MTKKLEKAIAPKVLQLINEKKPSYIVLAFCKGAGLLIVDDIVFVANLEIDCRFENLIPEVKKLK